MLTRRTVLLTGSTAVAVGAVAGSVGVHLHLRRQIPLELAALAPLVGSRFRLDGAPVTLAGLAGPGGGAPQERAFTVTFRADEPLGVDGGIQTLEHDDGELVAFVSPVGLDGTEYEAVVNRTVR